MAQSASDIRAGGAFVELYAKDSELEKGLRRFQNRMASFGASLKNVGGVFTGIGDIGLAGIDYAVQKYAAFGAEIYRTHLRTGLTVESLTGLQYAARQTGVSTEVLERSIQLMGRKINEAEQGGKQAIGTFRELGLSVKDLAVLTPDQQFSKLADAISKVESPTLRSAAAMAIFGRMGGGYQILPLLERGAAGIKLLEDRAASLGLVMSTGDAFSAQHLTQTWDTFSDTVKFLGFNIAASVFPALDGVLDRIDNIMGAVSQWIGAHRQLVGTIVSGAGVALAAIGGIGTVLIGVAGGIALVGWTVGNLLVPLRAVTAVVGGVVSAIMFIPRAISGATLAFTTFFEFAEVGFTGLMAVITGIPVLLESIGAVLGAINIGALIVAAPAILGALPIAAAVVAGLVGVVALASHAIVDYGRYAKETITGYFGELASAASDAWSSMKSDAMTAFHGIAEAISGGDLPLAFSILMETLQIEFSTALDAIQTQWEAWHPISDLLNGNAIIRWLGGDPTNLFSGNGEQETANAPNLGDTSEQDAIAGRQAIIKRLDPVKDAAEIAKWKADIKRIEAQGGTDETNTAISASQGRQNQIDAERQALAGLVAQAKKEAADAAANAKNQGGFGLPDDDGEPSIASGAGGKQARDKALGDFNPYAIARMVAGLASTGQDPMITAAQRAAAQRDTHTALLQQIEVNTEKRLPALPGYKNPAGPGLTASITATPQAPTAAPAPPGPKPPPGPNPGISDDNPPPPGIDPDSVPTHTYGPFGHYPGPLEKYYGGPSHPGPYTPSGGFPPIPDMQPNTASTSDDSQMLKDRAAALEKEREMAAAASAALVARLGSGAGSPSAPPDRGVDAPDLTPQQIQSMYGGFPAASGAQNGGIFKEIKGILTSVATFLSSIDQKTRPQGAVPPQGPLVGN